MTVKEVSSIDEITPQDCNRWFYCWSCGLEYLDHSAEIHDDELVGKCECGAIQDKPVIEAFEGYTTLERRESENQQLTEWVS